MDGHDATRALVSMGFPGVVIGVTANSDDADKEAFIATGAYACLSKPLRVVALFDVIAEILLQQRVASSGV